MSSPTIPRPSDGPVRDVSKFATDPPADPAASGKKKKQKVAKGGDPKGNKGKKKKLVIAVAVLAVLAAAYLLVLKPKPAATGAPQPGIVLKLDPLTLNLEGGHYLKLSMALQFTTAAAAGGGGHGGGGEELDGSRALDIAISQLSNRRIAELNSAAARKKAKATLLEAVAEAYHHEVMDIYFTEFVMQ